MNRQADIDKKRKDCNWSLWGTFEGCCRTIPAWGMGRKNWRKAAEPQW